MPGDTDFPCSLEHSLWLADQILRRVLELSLAAGVDVGVGSFVKGAIAQLVEAARLDRETRLSKEAA